MGTSVSQRSPNTPGWRVVSACYTSDTVPVDRAVVEIWRAATKQDQSLLQQLDSATVETCVSAANQRVDSRRAAQTIGELSVSKNNTVIGEFAKRMLALKSNGGAQEDTPTAALFRQLTDYYVSRDIAGYLGDNFRCKTLSELRAFKQQIGDAVAAKVKTLEIAEGLSQRNWGDAYRIILKKLQE